MDCWQALVWPVLESKGETCETHVGRHIATRVVTKLFHLNISCRDEEMNYKDESAQVLEMVDPFDIG